MRARASKPSRTSSRRPAQAASATTICLLVILAGSLIDLEARAAEAAWVRGGVRLNVRTGPGTQFRIVNGIKTGDQVEILQRDKDWTKVGLDDGASGWIPVGYLKSDPPAALQMEQLEKETALLRQTSATLTRESGQLKKLNQELAIQDEQLQREVNQLRSENARMKAQARWPEWITGAAIIFAGMAMGAILQRSSGRRTSSRIRL